MNRQQLGQAWETTQSVGRLLSLVLIPILLALIGSGIQSSLKQADVGLRMVELSIEILQGPLPGTGEGSSLRDWAVDVLDVYSAVKLTPAARRELAGAPLPRAAPPSPELYVQIFPEEISLNEPTAVYVLVYTLPDRQPIGDAIVTIVAEGGVFDASGRPRVRGVTDADGQFSASWQLARPGDPTADPDERPTEPTRQGIVEFCVSVDAAGRTLSSSSFVQITDPEAHGQD